MTGLRGLNKNLPKSPSALTGCSVTDVNVSVGLSTPLANYCRPEHVDFCCCELLLLLLIVVVAVVTAAAVVAVVVTVGC